MALAMISTRAALTLTPAQPGLQQPMQPLPLPQSTNLYTHHCATNDYPSNLPPATTELGTNATISNEVESDRWNSPCDCM